MTPSSSKQLNSFTGSALIFKSKRSHILVGDKKFSCSVWNLFFFSLPGKFGLQAGQFSNSTLLTRSNAGGKKHVSRSASCIQNSFHLRCSLEVISNSYSKKSWKSLLQRS